MGNFKTLRDYLSAGCPEGDFLFESPIIVREGGADVYEVVRESPVQDSYLFIRPVNGRPSELEKVHVPLKQHLDDKIHSNSIPPPQS